MARCRTNRNRLRGEGFSASLRALDMKWVIHHAKRVARITAGVLLLLIGLAMSIPGVPGPGLLVIFAGLSILAIDFVWAHRVKTKIQDTAKNAVQKVRGLKKPAGAAPAERVDVPLAK